MTDQIIITAAEAIDLLNDSEEYIHNFANPGTNLLVGIDYSRADAIEAFREAARIEIGGDQCKAMKHPIVVFDSSGRHTFFEADMAKVEALEAAKLATTE